MLIYRIQQYKVGSLRGAVRVDVKIASMRREKKVVSCDSEGPQQLNKRAVCKLTRAVLNLDTRYVRTHKVCGYLAFAQVQRAAAAAAVPRGSIN